MTEPDLIAWLEADEARSRPFRARRLRLLTDLHQVGEQGFLLHGGHMSAHYFEEVRLAYLHGLFFVVPILVMCLLERDVAGRLYGAGLDDARKGRATDLITAAGERGLLDAEETAELRKLAAVRNALTHFRTPIEKGTQIARALETEQDYRDVAAADAEWAVTLMYKYILKRAL